MTDFFFENSKNEIKLFKNEQLGVFQMVGFLCIEFINNDISFVIYNRIFRAPY